jgi:hypothetical protein
MPANKSKKAQVRVLDTHTFTLFLDMKYYSNARTLTTEGVSIHLSGQGLACDNPLCQGGSDVATVYLLLEEKNQPILESSIDALCITISFFQAS